MTFKYSKKSVKLLLVVFFLCFSFFGTQAGEIEMKGVYKGENIYVENPFSPSGLGFCVFEVLVNDFTTTDEINSSFFEIDLSIYGFKFGDLIKITINHKEGCTPRVLNSEVILPESTFKIKAISLDTKAYLEWTSYEEHGSIPFIIEQFRWNKWVRVGSVSGKGTEGLNHYSYKVDYHSGRNKFRLKQIGSSKIARYSQSVQYANNVPEITFIPGNLGKVVDKIFFSAPTRFEIYNYYGKRVKTGTAHDIDVSKLDDGTYFLNYDNKTETFIKK